MKLCLAFFYLLQAKYGIGDYEAENSKAEGSSGEIENHRDIAYFEQALQSPYFVDKTDLLETLLNNYHDLYIITSPRYFGKSTNLDMARRFFEMHFTEHGDRIPRKTTKAYQMFTNKSLNLRITRNRAFIDEHLGEYPIIYFTFSGVTGSTYEEIVASMCQRVRDGFLPYKWLYTIMEQWHLEGRRYPETKKRVDAYLDVINNKTHVWEINAGIFALLEYIKKYLKKSAMVLIDDYDAPMLNAINNGVNAENLNFFMRSILSNCVESCVRGSYVFTLGVSRFFKDDNMYLDRLRVVTYQYFMNDHRLEGYFGFTEEEVNRLLDIKGVNEEERIKLKRYYNGYVIKMNNTLVYNPKGVIQYLETGTLDSIYETTPLIRGIMKCARHKDFFQEIVQLLLNKKLRRLLPRHMRRLLLADFADVVKNNCTALKFNLTDDYIFPFYDQGYVTNTTETYEYEIGEDWIVEHIYRIPNKVMEDELLLEFVQYYSNVYNVTIIDSDLFSTIHSIASASTASKPMLDHLSDILLRLMKLKAADNFKEFDFQNIIYGALFLNANFTPDIRLRKYDTNEETWFDDFDKAKIVSDDGNILTLVKIAFKKSTPECINEIINYVPFEPSNESKWELVKYLLINLKGISRIDVVECESRTKW